jgi:hypothetical protein
MVCLYYAVSKFVAADSLLLFLDHHQSYAVNEWFLIRNFLGMGVVV